MQNLINQFYQTIEVFKDNSVLMLAIIGGLWAINIVNLLTGYRLNYLGIYPRTLFGLIGIFFSPFLHAGFDHLFFNSIPLFILGNFLLLHGLPTFVLVTVIVMIVGGLGTWLLGRPGFHVGASGVIMGYWSFLLVDAYYHTTPVSIALAFVCVYYFGGMIFSVLPMKLKSSWEAHLFGFFGGILAAYTAPMLLPLLPLTP